MNENQESEDIGAEGMDDASERERVACILEHAASMLRAHGSSVAGVVVVLAAEDGAVENAYHGQDHMRMIGACRMMSRVIEEIVASTREDAVHLTEDES
jgi:hypothetical protein